MRLLSPLLVLLAFALPAKAQQAPITGYWSTDEGGVIEIFPCNDGAEDICGQIISKSGRRDVENPDPALRDRSLNGLVMIQDMEPGKPGRWSGGTIYNVNDGKTYRGKLKLLEDGNLKLSGCLLFICQGRIWTPLTPKQAMAQVDSKAAGN